MQIVFARRNFRSRHPSIPGSHPEQTNVHLHVSCKYSISSSFQILSRLPTFKHPSARLHQAPTPIGCSLLKSVCRTGVCEAPLKAVSRHRFDSPGARCCVLLRVTRVLQRSGIIATEIESSSTFHHKDTWNFAVHTTPVAFKRRCHRWTPAFSPA